MRIGHPFSRPKELLRQTFPPLPRIWPLSAFRRSPALQALFSQPQTCLGHFVP